MAIHIKDMLFESGSKPAPHPATQTTPPQAHSYIHTDTTAGYPNGAPSVAVADDGGANHADDAYQRVLAHSDFTQTTVYQTLQKYVAPLMDVLPDEKTRFRAAVKQAAAQSGFDPASIATAFDQLKTDLSKTADNFSASVDHAIAEGVDAKNKQAESLTTQVQSLQAQIAQLKEDAFATQQKIEAGKHRFDTALQTRQQELATEAAKYAGLLA
jgi:outer membrane murein-binding lipoprotein Lpp